MLLIMRRINERMCRYDKMNYVVAIMNIRIGMRQTIHFYLDIFS